MRLNFEKSILLFLTISCLSTPNSGWCDGDNTGEHIHAARRYMQSGQWDYACFEWRTVLAQQPNRVEAHLGLAESLSRSGYLVEGIRQLESAQQSIKKRELDLALAQAYEKNGEIQKALTLYQKIFSHNAFDPQAFAGVRRLLGQWPDGLAQGEKQALQHLLDSKTQQARAQAKQALQSHRYNTAAPYFEILSLADQRPAARNDYALSLLLAGELRQSAAVFGGWKSGELSWQPLANAALAYLGMGQGYHAQQLMETAIGLAPQSALKARLFNNLGYIYESQNKRTKARFAYERALDLDPSFTKARANLAYIYQREREFDRAVETYRELLQVDPNNAMAYNRLGFTYELMHKERAAIEAYKKALTVDPTLKEAYFNLGTLYKKMNRLDKAGEAFKRMTDLEFQAMEDKPKTGKASSGAPTPPPLFQFVDVFFMDSMS